MMFNIVALPFDFPFSGEGVLKMNLRQACITNPTAAGRFLVAGGFTGLPLIFPHCTDTVQN
jgi:hypothetical protein